MAGVTDEDRTLLREVVRLRELILRKMQERQDHMNRLTEIDTFLADTRRELREKAKMLAGGEVCWQA